MLTREQLTQNISAMEKQGARPDEIQAYLNSFKTQQSSQTAQTPTPPSDPFSPIGKPSAGLLATARTFVDALGFGKTADTIGINMARANVTPAQRAYIPAPTGKENAAAALNVGSLLIPTAATERVAGGLLARVLPKVVPKVVSNVLPKVISGLAVGGTFDAGQNLQNGKAALTPGIGTALGIAGPLASEGVKAVGAGVKALSRQAAPALINSLIKPLAKGFSYGKDPGRAVAQLGITGNSLEELTKNIASARDVIGENLQKTGAQVPGQLAITQSQILSPFDKAITKAVQHNDQVLVNRLSQTRDSLSQIFHLDEKGQVKPIGSRILSDLSYQHGVALKQMIGDMTKWTGNTTEDETVNGALTRTYGIIKDALNTLADKVSPELGAQLRKLNEQYADLTSAQIASKYRDVLEKRHNLVNLPGKIGLGLSLVAAPFTGGLSSIATITGAIASVGIDKALSSPTFKTRLAAWLAKATPAEKAVLTKAYPQVAKTFTSPGDMVLNHLQKNPPSLGLSVKDVSAKIHPEDLSVMKDFADYVAGDYKPSAKDAQALEKDAQRLAEHYGFTATASNQALANQFGRALDSQQGTLSKWSQTTKAQARDTKTQQFLPKSKK